MIYATFGIFAVVGATWLAFIAYVGPEGSRQRRVTSRSLWSQIADGFNAFTARVCAAANEMEAAFKPALSALARLQVEGEICDICSDIDVWRDQRPGTMLAIARARLGDSPTYSELHAERDRLLKQANRNGLTEEEGTV